VFENREFSSCSHSEICNFHVQEGKANAHAGMPFFWRISVCRAKFMVNGNSPFWGVGRLHLSCTGFAEPQSDRCNDLRLFYSEEKVTMIFAERSYLHRC